MSLDDAIERLALEDGVLPILRDAKAPEAEHNRLSRACLFHTEHSIDLAVRADFPSQRGHH